MSGGEPKFPCSQLVSREIKQHLQEQLLDPLSRAEKRVCAFRMAWRINDKAAQEEIWYQMPQYHAKVIDAIKMLDCIGFFISTVTATTTAYGKLPNKPSVVYPAVAFWVVMKDGNFAEMQQALLMKAHSNPYNAEVKLLGSSSKCDAMKKALHIVMKDSNGKFVEWKALAAYAGEEIQKRPALTQILYCDKQYEDMLMNLQVHLTASGVTSAIQHY